MKKLLVSTTFILLAFTPFIFGNHNWNQDLADQENNSDDNILKEDLSSKENYKVFEDAILLINDETTLADYQILPEVDIDDLTEFEFVSILNQRPDSERAKILSRHFSYQDFTILELKSQIENGEITFFDETGNQAFQQKFNGHDIELKRNDLNAGIYFYKISENGNAINSGKIVVN